ncbi:DUF2927 domain-containing protein [Roseovarius sp. EL26]|uniref:DUF2927 domain-containing protein n=1 Tax=Roseovarius sp. EL26 TaxID=2126672 RepID=UPI000EA108CC|nr:DUF2927 domain-containing protein [Roseovarius sp. EL26]
MTRRRWADKWAGGLALLLLTACVTPQPPAPAPPPDPEAGGFGTQAPVRPSEQSLALARYYGRVQADLLVQGLLRVDGGGVDTPFTDTDLVRNFDRIAFYDEYAPNGGFAKGSEQAGGLRKWAGPVRLGIEFGGSVPQAQRDLDTQVVQDYSRRLARITGHPISVGNARSANFHVLFMGEDDRTEAVTRIKQIEPGVNAATLGMIQRLPRSIHCIVVAFAAQENSRTYRSAVALIRAEHPNLTRKSCVHEELAQGLGLANDSPKARPSIFNDDDEFALLTTHDEMLLKMLYDPDLHVGMKREEVLPLIREMAAELTEGPPGS